MMKKRGIKLAITAVLSLSLLLTACGDKETNTTKEGDIDLSKYPIETDVELTYWCDLPSTLTTVVDNIGKTPQAQELSKRTGVNIKYTHPAAGQQIQALNLMVASGELPDMIAYTWSWYNGGVERTYSDKVLIDITEMMDEVAPNLKKWLGDHPEFDKLVKTDSKRYLYFPVILDGDKLVTTTGPIVRQDLLDKFNIKSPETTEEWTQMLREFKKNGIDIPMSFNYSHIGHLYKIFNSPYDFYRDENDVIQFGMVSEEFKNAIIGIREWYKEGLLDKNIVSVDGKMIDSYILNGKTAVSIASGGGGLGKYIEAAPNKEFNLVGLMYPAEEAGKVSKWNYMAPKHSGTGVGITTSCDYPKLAAKFLDYAYSDEGHMFINFGVEGLTYDMVDGYPTYTDLIMKNPEGKAFSQVLSEYTQANNLRAGIQDERYIEQFYSKPQQQIAVREWSKGVQRTLDETSVPYLIFTEEESARHTELYNEILNYAIGMNVKFFTGVESIEEKFDEYVKRLYDLGLQEVLDIENAAYKRYKNR